jgi:membrane-bound inhibitor of C-type lysozyme/uncharacterized lipoprotein YbaY
MTLIAALPPTVTGCAERPPEASTKSADPASTAARAEPVPFRVEVALVAPQSLPDGARLNVYVVESDLEAGSRRAIAEHTATGPLQFPLVAQVNVPKAALNPDRGYEVIAVVVDAAGKVILDATGYRPPMPGAGLAREDTYLVTLGPVVTPAAPAAAFRLPNTLSLVCDGVAMQVRQVDGNDVVLTSPAGEVRLPPAVTAAGGRFSDGSTEFWITQRQEAIVILPGAQPVICSVD